jgi:hypothetical protein
MSTDYRLARMSRRDPLVWVNGRPGWIHRERNHTLRHAILYGLTVALITHAALTVLFSPRRNR